VHFASLKDYTGAREPTVILAAAGNDVSFMPFSSNDRILNMSKFDVGGVYSNGDTNNLSAYVFTDRGLYRPGDLTHIAAIVKANGADAPPVDLPLAFTITDPRGNVVKDSRFNLDKSGLATLDFASSETTITGDYTANLYIVKDNLPNNLLGSTTFKTAEFLPDTMRITGKLNQSSTQGWLKPTNLSADFSLVNLFGSPATQRKMSGKIVLSPQAFKFAAFPNYIFVDPLLDQTDAPKTFTDTLGSEVTNDKGQAIFDLNVDRYAKSTFQLTVYAEGFEANGGRSVTTQLNAIVSPLDYLVGYHAQDNLTFVKPDSSVKIKLIAIDNTLKPIPLDNLTAQLRLLQPISTLVKKPMEHININLSYKLQFSAINLSRLLRVKTNLI